LSIEIVFETNSWSVDNERGIATGWLPGRLSEKGKQVRENSASADEGTILSRFSHLIWIVPSRPLRLPSADLGFQSTKISALASATTAFSTGHPWRAS
jgi:hypothetical protein